MVSRFDSKAYQAAYYQSHKKEFAAYARDQYRRHGRRINDRTISYQQRIRAEMIVAYGSACKCCGVTEPKFLTLDHINRDGAEHRRRAGKHGVYNDLRRRGWPQEGYQLLCWNCNCATKYGRPCPHKKGDTKWDA